MPAVQLVKLQAPRVGGLSLRARLEAEIDRLIALLDALDGDCDLEVSNEDEDGGDEEPSLGWQTPGVRELPEGWGYSTFGAVGGDREA